MRGSAGARGRRGRADGVRVPPEEVFAGRAWFRGRLQGVEIGVGPDGRITEIGRRVSGPSRHDFGDLVILPSSTDIHVHFREPGGPADVESFETGTVGAALGGVGLVADMPNTVPPVTDRERLGTKAAGARGRLAVDLLLYGAATTPAAVRSLGRAAGAFKLYMSPTTGIDQPPEPATMRAILEAVGATGLALSVHAEAPDRFRHHPDRPVESTADWDAERPPDAEARAVDRLLPAPAALRLHIAHVTTATVAERLAEAGHSFEASPHHLLLAARPNGDARSKVNPPLRSEPERARLWEAFCAGRVPIVASDHAPHPADAKALPFDRAPSGMPGVQTLLPLLLARVRTGELSLPTLLAAACDRPARWLGAPQGRLAVGHRANFVVVDFRERRPITARTLHAPCGWTAFEGHEGIFPSEHYRDGRPIVQGGEYVGGAHGRILRPEYAMDAL
jgi:dihydroorotase